MGSVERVVTGCRLHYEVSGHGAGVVLAHSLGMSREMWFQQADVARDDSVLGYDARGHGRSESARGPCSTELFSDDLRALLDAEQIDRVHPVGVEPCPGRHDDPVCRRVPSSWTPGPRIRPRHPSPVICLP